MKSAEVRKGYLEFFRRKSHTIVPSASLMPTSPNLLFTNAGMNQFVPIFLGQAKFPNSPARAADTQKCIRAGGKHNDLEDVGFDTYHHTFFEMLGNWSFGDYFKKESIDWAWELLVDIWKFPPARLYATVYKPGPGDPAEFDSEAHGYWVDKFKKAGLDPAVHVVMGNAKDNFWMMGETGPCGPCSEVHVDLTPEGKTQGKLVNQGDPRCLEIWNLVFIQFNAEPGGKFKPLPERHVDTGMGLERVAGILAVSDGFKDFKKDPSNYASDLFAPIFAEIEKMSGKKYGARVPKNREEVSEEEMNDCIFRVLADHVRTLSFSIADGIVPGNEGRNYVLRRILRRAVMFGRRFKLPDGFLSELATPLIRTMGEAFPELKAREKDIRAVLSAEEASFSKTLERGLAMFEKLVAGSNKGIQGEDAFTLYDTYGFPLDLTQLLARERGMEVDGAGFEKAMEAQRSRARQSQNKTTIKVEDEVGPDFPTVFTGYEKTEESKVERLAAEALKEVGPAGAKGRVFLGQTPFYGEMGGQVGDTGWIEWDGKKVKVVATIRGAGGVPVHLTDSVVDAKGPVKVSLDTERRGRIEGHHSATHLLHWALRSVLGEGVRQKGSYVGPDRLRFDFSHLKAMSGEELAKVESQVNEKVKADVAVKWGERPYAEVKDDTTILQFFGDKYGTTVRVVDIGGFSKELCGGTHVRSTGKIGAIRVVGESAIAAGVRRIEAVSGAALADWCREEMKKQDEKAVSLEKKKVGAGQLSKGSGKETPEQLWDLVKKRDGEISKADESLREGDKQAAKDRMAEMQKKAEQDAKELWAKGTVLSGIKWLGVDLGEVPNGYLPVLADRLKREGEAVLFLIGKEGGKVPLVALCTAEAAKNVQAGKIIQVAAVEVGGKGGGRPDMAQGSGADASGIDKALAAVEKMVKAALGGGA
ncbi:AlaS Alanyl-tRNA synthetase [Candidatus Methylacidiphilaceae bacterium]